MTRFSKAAKKHSKAQYMAVRYMLAVTTCLPDVGNVDVPDARINRITNNSISGNKAVIGATLEQARIFLGALSRLHVTD